MIELYGTKRVTNAAARFELSKRSKNFQISASASIFKCTPNLKVRASSIFDTHASHPSKKCQFWGLFFYTYNSICAFRAFFFSDFSSPKSKDMFESR